MNRGQAEIIGLVVIILLLAVGFLFYVRFNFNHQGHDTKAAFEKSTLGQSFVNSLAETTVICGGINYTVADLVRDVAKGTPRCDAETTLNTFFRGVLQKTNYLWGRNYNLSVVRRSSDSLETIGLEDFSNPDEQERCNSHVPHTTDYYLLPAYGGLLFPVEIRLMQC